MGKRKLESGSSEKKKKERKNEIRLAEPTNRIPTEMKPNSLNSSFCTQMANKVLIEELKEEDNIVLSPLSFQLMLSLIALGSKGQTLEQLLSHLGSKSIDQLNEFSSQIVNATLKSNYDQKGPLIAFANGVWVDQRFRLKPLFEKVAEDAYKAKTKEVDFATKADKAIEDINSWVKKETRGLITDILPLGSLESATAIVLANDLYFKGEWDRKFNKQLTKNKTFHLMDRKTVEVPFMTSNKEKYLYKSYDGYDVLAIPYKKSEDTRRFSMYFFLPNEIEGLPTFLHKINSDPNFFSQNFKLQSMEINRLWIPKFKFSFKFEASKIIKEMGVHLPFTNVADFSQMVDSTGSGKVHLSNMFHKSFIEVNEDGTEARASTYSTFYLCSYIKSPLIRFVADHPFMFMIREEVSSVVLFSGAVMNPL